jgi:hypothetical protein
MAEVMAKLLTCESARSKDAAEEVAIKYASEPFTYWAS